MQELRDLLKDWWGYCDHCQCVIALCPRCGFGSCSATSCLYCHMIFSLVNRLDDLDLPSEAEAREADAQRPRLDDPTRDRQFETWQRDNPELNQLLRGGKPVDPV